MNWVSPLFFAVHWRIRHGSSPCINVPTCLVFLGGRRAAHALASSQIYCPSRELRKTLTDPLQSCFRLAGAQRGRADAAEVELVEHTARNSLAGGGLGGGGGGLANNRQCPRNSR